MCVCVYVCVCVCVCVCACVPMSRRRSGQSLATLRPSAFSVVIRNMYIRPATGSDWNSAVPWSRSMVAFLTSLNLVMLLAGFWVYSILAFVRLSPPVCILSHTIITVFWSVVFAIVQLALGTERETNNCEINNKTHN